jgi:hypothetical protein
MPQAKMLRPQSKMLGPQAKMLKNIVTLRLNIKKKH